MSINAAQELVAFIESADLNEADTRFHIIDRLFEQVLAWPRAAFRLEKSTIEGFSDYHFMRPNGRPALILEAKRTGIHFQVPPNFNQAKLYREVRIKALLTDASIKGAMIQAQRYAADEGSEYAGISNGRQVIIFKVFERGKPWKELPAVVIGDLTWFADNYVEAIALLGYSSLIERNSLKTHFEHKSAESRELFFPKDKILAFNQIVNANMLAVPLRPVVQRFFGPLDVDDSEFIEQCYVNQRAYDKSLKGIRSILRDSVSPFMETYGVKETEDNKRGGSLAKRLTKGVMQRRAGDVVVLFGGKGSGKSTFVRRVLKHQPPQYLKKHSAAVIVDLLGAPKDQIAVREFIWRSLVVQLDSHGFMDGERDALLTLFDDRWQTACKQDLYGFDTTQPIYNERLNALLAAWKQDIHYVARRLALWHARQHKGVIVVIDNTDQLENELQDYSFSIAEEIGRELSCVVLISMREERFYASKIRGMLDAYQNSAFHISSPTPSEVFERRINYVMDLIRRKRLGIDDGLKRDLLKFLRIFKADFARDPISPLNRFISACAHGNIRLALDLFGELIVSGYTNAREMVEISGVWTVLIHQVIRPLMTPTRLFYDEKLSRVPNVFQIRTPDGGSHFTGLRVLRFLVAGQDPTSPGYVPFAELRSHFGAVFGNDIDLRKWLDRLLGANLVEASTRQDYFTDEMDSLRITPFGQFALEELHRTFTYLDLASTDCGVRDEFTCNTLVRLANEEIQYLNDRKRFERVEKRLEKTKEFINYLRREEDREIELFGLTEDDKFVPGIAAALALEEPRVLQSARKNA